MLNTQIQIFKCILSWSCHPHPNGTTSHHQAADANAVLMWGRHSPQCVTPPVWGCLWLIPISIPEVTVSTMGQTGYFLMWSLFLSVHNLLSSAVHIASLQNNCMWVFLLWWSVLFSANEQMISRSCPEEIPSGKPLPQKQSALQTVCSKMKGQIDFGRAKLRPILSIDAEGHFPLEACSVTMRDMELILTVKKKSFSSGNWFQQWRSIQEIL